MAALPADVEDNLERTLEEIGALRSILGDEEEHAVTCEMRENNMVVTIVVYPTAQPTGKYHLTLVATLTNLYPSHAPPSFEVLPSSIISSSVYAESSTIFANLWADAEGEVMIYEAIQWLSERLSQWLTTRETQLDTERLQLQQQLELTATRVQAEQELLLHCSARFVHGETLSDRRSVFQAHLVSTTNVNEIPLLLRALKSDRKIAAAAHNIWSYRVGTQYSDNDDDGETAAGKRLALLLTHSNATNVFVVVTRWYGGIHLGPDRFRHINNVARLLMVREGIIAGSCVEKKKKQEKKR